MSLYIGKAGRSKFMLPVDVATELLFPVGLR